MPYGNWSADRAEYIIRRPDTPAPWYNLLANGRYAALISHTGGGWGRRTDVRADWVAGHGDLHTDRPGRYVYVREKRSGRLFSVNWQPIRGHLDLWEAHHGLGCSGIAAEQEGLRAELVYFVPREDPLEIWVCRFRNLGSKPASFSVFACAEVLVPPGGRGASGDELGIRARFDAGLRAIVATRRGRAGSAPATHAFFAGSQEPAAFETRRSELLGRFGSPSAPEALRRGSLQGGIASGELAVAALQYELELGPGEERSFHVMLGAGTDESAIPGLVGKYSGADAVGAELAAVRAGWARDLPASLLSTPDAELDAMAGRWGRYQIRQLASASWGSGDLAGIGGSWRDRADMARALVTLDPARGRKAILAMLASQLSSGEFQASPGETGAGRPSGANPEGGVEACIWVPLALCELIKETGERALLEEKVGFADRGGATVYQHAMQAMELVHRRRGKHGLPRAGRDDGEEGLDAEGLEGRAESVWLGVLLSHLVSELEDLALFLGERSRARRLKDRYEALAETVDRLAWDGRRYRRLLADDGRWIGGEEDGGRTFLEVQTWAMLSGVAHEERCRTILETLREGSFSRFGPASLSKPFEAPDPRVGSLASLPPGIGFNGGIDVRATLQLASALALHGHGEAAMALVRQVAPFEHGREMDLYRAEPYAWASRIAGAAHPAHAGAASGTWEPGAAEWAHLAVTEWIAGVRAGYDGLVIDPCLPPGWEELSLEREYRGATYEVRVHNPKGRQKGVAFLTVDGARQHANVIPAHADGKRHRVDVTMG